MLLKTQNSHLNFNLFTIRNFFRGYTSERQRKTGQLRSLSELCWGERKNEIHAQVCVQAYFLYTLRSTLRQCSLWKMCFNSMRVLIIFFHRSLMKRAIKWRSYVNETYIQWKKPLALIYYDLGVTKPQLNPFLYLVRCICNF